MTTAALLLALIQQAPLSGVVRDSVDLEPVGFARITISVADGPTASADSDRFGAFVVANVQAGPVRVEVDAYGYATWVQSYSELPREELRVLLRPDPIAIDSIVVNVRGQVGNPISRSRDAFVVDTAVMRMIPTILETDALRAVAMSPSASAPSDWTAIPYIRGGTSVETPVMLDGVRLFSPHHLGGFLSAVNAEAVERVTLLTSSAEGAQPFGSLSGAIEIQTRDGARDRRRVTGSLGLASSRLAVEGPIGESTSFIVDGRRTYIDLIFSGLRGMGATEAVIPYAFDDLHAKVTRDFGGVRRLSVTGYINSEAFDNLDEEYNETAKLGWGNAAVAAHYRQRLGPVTLVDATVGHSRFSSNIHGLGGGRRLAAGLRGTYEPPEDTVILGNGFMSEHRADVRVTRYTDHATATVGVQATGFSADHSYAVDDKHRHLQQIILSSLHVQATQWRLAAYSSVDVGLGPRLSSRAGLRLDHFARLGTTLAPFAELGYSGSWWRARILAARSHQALSSMRDEETVGASFLAYDLLAPVVEGPVPRNTEISVGWEAVRGFFSLRLDGYVRELENIRVPKLGTNPLGATTLGDPGRREVASGAARGIEASWSWARGSVATLGSYRWSRASRTVGDETYTPRVHRDHEFEFGVAVTKGGSSWSGRVSARSGQPTTRMLAVAPYVNYNSPENLEQYPVFRDMVAFGGEYNSARLPLYLRLDVGWRHRSDVSWFGGGSVTPFVAIANLFSLPNVVAAVAEPNFDREVVSDRAGIIDQVYLPQMPMLPFFGVEFRF